MNVIVGVVDNSQKHINQHKENQDDKEDEKLKNDVEGRFRSEEKER